MSDRGTLPPPEVLASWPKPNYINPENQTAQLMAVEITLCSFTTIVMALRLYSRGVLTKSIGTDDWLMTGALIFAIGLTIVNCLAPQWGWGVHLYDFKPEWIVPARKLAVATEVLFTPCVALTKLSILLFYHRVFSSRRFRYFIYGGAAYIISYTISAIIVVFLQAIPLRAYWDKSIPGRFIDGQLAFVIYGALNCLSDLYVFFLPIREVWTIQLPKKQRISLVLVFALGSIVCIAGIIRIYYLWIVFSPTNWDFTYQGGPLYIVTAIEGDLGILCASLPALKPFIHRYAPGLLGSSSGRSRPTGASPSYRLESYDVDRRRDTRRITGTGAHSYKMTSIVTGPTILDNESEENILPMQGVGNNGWDRMGGSSDGHGNGGSEGRNGIGKKVEIEVTVENISNGTVEDLEKQGPLSPRSPRRI
ncbi:hypothetical protein H072_9747 [Dactylellina haptotyla CBS 200.50]|uniref:Rhodopsin domain-containing protein n=1 Tax=Dactylellina haptotyla (strain CBS 200.50) TaxID=1284197 RepID=S8A1V4_DACHA|nr:hypothetical protein H072_9747 [Dactylellina haptotyla CBS 200.50]